MVLRRIPGSRFSEVIPLWSDKIVVILGGGPSLTAEQVALIAGAHCTDSVRCIAVNDTYLWAPWADILYAADASWHEWQIKGIPKFHLKLSASDVSERFKNFAGQKCSIESQIGSITDDATHILRNACRDPNGRPIHGFGLSSDPRAIITGSNSGAQALNVAFLAGTKKIILLGFDGRVSRDGKTHWHGGHSVPTPEAAYEQYRRSFSLSESSLLAAGVEVINCSPLTGIDTFPKADLQKTLDAMKCHSV